MRKVQWRPSNTSDQDEGDTVVEIQMNFPSYLKLWCESSSSRINRALGDFFGFLACCCSTSSASCFVASFVAVSCRQETLKSNNRYHLGFFLRISLHTDAFGLPNQVNMGMKGPPKTRVALYMAKVKGQAFTPTRHELVLSGVCLLKPTLPSMLDVVLCSSGP